MYDFYESYNINVRGYIIMSFGRKLKQLRKSARITQTELAEKLNITTRTLINYETGKSYPKQTEIYADIASIFDVTVDFLMSENEDLFKNEADYKKTPQIRAKKAADEIISLMKCEELSDNEKDILMKAITDAYWDLKKI